SCPRAALAVVERVGGLHGMAVSLSSPALPEGWPSGRRRTPGKCVDVNSVSRVRIPPPPPYRAGLAPSAGGSSCKLGLEPCHLDLPAVKPIRLGQAKRTV